MARRVYPTRETALCALFVALLSIGAHLAIPTPLAPITLQTLFVALAGMLLKARWGVVCTLTYLAMGLIGLPVFSQGGGIAYALKPSFGYALGFVAGAYASGAIADAPAPPSFRRLLFAAFAGMALIYCVGIAYALMLNALILHVEQDFGRLLVYGCAIFLPCDAVCCLIAAMLARRLLPVLS